MVGALSFMADVSGKFAEDFQFDGFQFEVNSGTMITIDTAKGTNIDLDNTLYLYGPAKEVDVMKLLVTMTVDQKPLPVLRISQLKKPALILWL
jgi:hypothetical protein